MSCADLERRVALYAGGDLDDESARVVESHLAACDGCRELLTVLRGQREAMGDWRTAGPSQDALDEVRNGVLAAIARGDARRSFIDRIRFAPFRSLAWGSAGLAAAALIVVAVWITPRPQDVQPAPSGTAQPGHAASQADAVVSTPEPTPVPAQPERRTAAQRATPAPDTRPVPGARRRVATHPPSPAATLAVVGAPRGNGPPDGPARRIEFQTADPNIRIIWLMPEPGAEPGRSGVPSR